MWLGVLAILVAGFIGGQSPLFLKLAQRDFSPLFLTEIRFLIASLVMLPFFLKQKDLVVQSFGIRHMFFQSVFFALNVVVFSLAIQYTTAIVSTVLYGLTPLIVMIFGYFMLDERVTKNMVIGLGLSLTGLAFILWQSFAKAGVMTFGSPLGNGLTLFAVFSWAIYLVFSRQMIKKYTPVTTSFISFVLTSVLLIPVILIDSMQHPLVLRITPLGVISIVILGVLSSAIAFFLIQYGVKHTTAFIASLQQYVGPFASALTAIPVLGEKLTPALFFGGLLIISGVFYATTLSTMKKIRKK